MKGRFLAFMHFKETSNDVCGLGGAVSPSESKLFFLILSPKPFASLLWMREAYILYTVLQRELGLKESGSFWSFGSPLKMATMKASDHDEGEEPPRYASLKCLRRWFLNESDAHFQSSDGMSSGPGVLPILSLERTRSSSIRVKGSSSISARSGKSGGLFWGVL